MIQRIHHVNFLVHNLETAVAQYRRLLGGQAPVREALPDRGVLTARFRVGETWLVLIQPYDSGGVPARHLARNGEGFFMISFADEALDETLARLEEQGIEVRDREDRVGLDGWRVRDLQDICGVAVQLTRVDRE